MAILPEKKPILVLGVRYSERRDDPPPGLKWHKAGKKETLGSIADDYGIQWRDLALYNFHTIKAQEINWYLRKFVGASKNNGKVYEFTGDEKPGYLLVPDRPAVTTRPPRKTVGGIRNGKAT